MSASAALRRDTVQDRLQREAAQTEVDRSRGDLQGILGSAAHKRRQFKEALDAMRHHGFQAFGGAAAASLGTVAACVLATLRPDLAPMAWGAAALLGTVATTCFGYGFYVQASDAYVTLYDDVIAAGVVLSRLRGLRVGDAHASHAGQQALSECVDEFSVICNRHLDISPNKFANTRRHQRYDVNRLIHITQGASKPFPVLAFDISRSGIGVKTEAKFKIGAVVRIGRTEARVARAVKDGIAFEFLKVFAPDAFSPDMAL